MAKATQRTGTINLCPDKPKEKEKELLQVNGQQAAQIDITVISIMDI